MYVCMIYIYIYIQYYCILIHNVHMYVLCSFMSMDDLLNKMIMQAKQEGRESLRQLVSAINGIAGIHILQKQVRKRRRGKRKRKMLRNTCKLEK